MNPFGSRAERSAPTQDQVGRAFRRLADEHIEARHNDSEAIWRRLTVREKRSLALVAGRPRRPMWRFIGGAAALSAVAVCATVAIMSWPTSHSLRFEVEGGNRSGAVVATEDTSARITFSEASTVGLSPHTTLRVTTEGKAHVLARLAQGEIDVHVVHRRDTDYRFWAGPYEVLVVGTSFHLAFEPRGERMQLALREGKVRIFDAQRGAHDVTAGNNVVFEAGRPRLPMIESGRVGPASASEPSDPRPSAVASHDVRLDGTSSDPGARGTPSGSYAAWAANGRFAAIVENAERTGIDKVLAEKAAGELQQLAQAANYTGNPSLAKRTWVSMQRRFAGQPAAINANFFLGRLSEQSGDSGRALGYFNAYLAGAPRGTYAAEALGRKLLLVDPSAAAGLAREYLARFPRGAYAENARRLVGSE